MSKETDQTNRYGKRAVTNIPDDAPLSERPGHKLRSSTEIVDRRRLPPDSPTVQGQTIQTVEGDGESGLIRFSDTESGEHQVPNQFTGPSFRTKQERFRFDGHKMIYHLDRVQAWKRGERFAPVHIDMGLTKFCNTACIYCYAVVQNMTRGTLIQSDALLRFIEDCGQIGVKSLGFIGDGEPTLNPALYDATSLAHTLGVDTAMATNGLLLDLDRAHELLRAMSYIRFNLSAGTPEGFQRVHQSHSRNFDILKENIRTLVALKRQHGYDCTLGIQMVLIPECFDEVIPEAELGAELGVDYFVIKHCSDSEYKELGVDYDDYRDMGERLQQAEALSTDNYVVQVKWNKINAAGETPLYKDGYRKYDVCYGTPFLVQISGNGKVYPCGPFFNKERFLIGDLHETSFKEMVQGERYWQVHKDVSDSVDVHKDCAIGCRQDYINKFLWDLENPPEHVNFI
ncbi:MAG: radical SAM protein [Magnetococcales bacterium]|nr:radical SAM protein [Magnetococcales bacterium]